MLSPPFRIVPTGFHGHDHPRLPLAACRHLGDAAGYSLHRWQRGRRALLVLRDEVDPRRLHDAASAVERRQARLHDRDGVAGVDAPLRRQRLLLSGDRRNRGRCVPRQVPHDPAALGRVLRGPLLPGPDGHAPAAPRRHARTAGLAARRPGPGGDRGWRHQALRVGPRRRPVRAVEPPPAGTRVRLVLLRDQLRFVLLDPAHALAPRASWCRMGLRRAGHPDGDRHAGVLAGPPSLRPRAPAGIGLLRRDLRPAGARRDRQTRAALPAGGGLLVALRPDGRRLGAAGGADGPPVPRHRLAREPDPGDQSAAGADLHPAVQPGYLSGRGSRLHLHAAPPDPRRLRPHGSRLRDLGHGSGADRRRVGPTGGLRPAGRRWSGSSRPTW